MNAQQENFSGLRVASFESRRADDTARLIEKHGGQPFVSPSMREVAMEASADVLNFANESTKASENRLGMVKKITRYRSNVDPT